MTASASDRDAASGVRGRDLGAHRGATGEELAAAAEHPRIVMGDEVREALLSMPAENL